MFGESFTQVNQFISIGSTDFGFTSLSTALSKENTNQFWSNVDPIFYTPIHQGVIIIEINKNRSKKKFNLSHQFSEYLFCKKNLKFP